MRERSGGLAGPGAAAPLHPKAASCWNKSSAISRTSEKGRKLPLRPGRALTVASRGRRGDRSGLTWWKRELWHHRGTNIYPGTSAPPQQHIYCSRPEERGTSLSKQGCGSSAGAGAALTFSCKCVRKHNEPITADSSLCLYYFRLPQLPDLMLQLTG